MKKFLFLYWSCFVLFSSCINTNPSGMQTTESVNMLKIEVPDLTDSILWRYSSIFSKVSYVALESSPTAYIGTIDYLKITENKDFIVLDITNRIIARFDSCGKYLNNIGEKGHGEKEYNYPVCISYDRYNEQVLVLDNGQKCLMFYDISGKFIKKIKFDNYVQSFEVLDRDKIALFFNYLPSGGGYNYWIITRNGEVLSKFEEYQLIQKLPYCLPGKCVFSNDARNNPVCLSPCSSVAYRFYNGKMIPFAEIMNRGEKWAIDNPMNIQETFKKHKKQRIKLFAQIKNSIFLQILSTNSIYTYSFANNKSFAGNIPEDDITGLTLIGDILVTDSNNVYYSIDPLTIESAMKDVQTTLDPLIYSKMDSLAKNINPIIQICEIRE